MWLITNFGFFSIVEKPNDKGGITLTVRSRVKADLLALRDRYLPEMGEIVANVGTDYQYRAKVSRNALANANARIMHDIDYSNFKNSVAEQQGLDRSHVYSGVWNVLYELQEIYNEPSLSELQPTGTPVAAETSYGGVLFDNDGRVLLREQSGHFDGYVWTFPKGRPEGAKTAEETALREVLEETGYHAEIVQSIPGSFAGGTGNNTYFVMKPIGAPAKTNSETQSIRWATPEEAKELIKQTTNAIGRKRDLNVLDSALTARGDSENHCPSRHVEGFKIEERATIFDFLNTELSIDELKTALKVIREFENGESFYEQLDNTFWPWIKLGQLREFLEYLVEGKELQASTLWFSPDFPYTSKRVDNMNLLRGHDEKKKVHTGIQTRSCSAG
jgi:8-oxo-dGTP pyrophosphatase MutT (NUDIX family)